ncbi:MAG: spinster family MFS transporter, partial [Hyphomonadaceae bacterium]
MLSILLLTYTTGWIDRGIMGILGQAIKTEMRLADWQLGLMTGFAFSVFYSLLGFPLARMAEKSSRVNLIAICMILWSGMTALCGMATNFLMLLAFRCGVGVGEAGCAPGCHSLLTDYFEPKQRTMAFSIYGLGVPLGGMSGAIIGGVLTQYVDWRFALIAVGFPGMILALILKLTVKEPERGRMESDAVKAAKAAAPPVPTPSLMEVWKTLWRKHTFRHIAAALALIGMSGGTSGAFLGAYYIRQFHLKYSEVGLIIGLMAGVTSIAGTLIGGVLAQKLGKSNAKWYMLVPAIGVCMSAPFSFAAYLQNHWYLMAGLLLLPNLLSASYLATAFASTHNMVGSEMRASAAATANFFLNIIGMAMGPVIGGLGIDMFSNHIFAETGLGAFGTLCPGGAALPGAAEV